MTRDGRVYEYFIAASDEREKAGARETERERVKKCAHEIMKIEERIW